MRKNVILGFLNRRKHGREFGKISKENSGDAEYCIRVFAFPVSITCFDRVDIYVCLYGAINNFPGEQSMRKDYKAIQLKLLISDTKN